MMKKVLILCTGNSCRSILAEALINAKLEGVEAQSSGVKASGRVNPNAKRLLEEQGLWKERYHSKTIESVIDEPFDLIVTVCDHAKENCPLFPHPTPTLHVGFEDPDGKPFEAFQKNLQEIASRLLPKIQEALQEKNHITQTDKGVHISFQASQKKADILRMVESCQTGACACMSQKTKEKIQTMEVKGEDGSVELTLQGDVSKEEIQEALQRSKHL